MKKPLHLEPIKVTFSTGSLTLEFLVYSDIRFAIVAPVCLILVYRLFISYSSVHDSYGVIEGIHDVAVLTICHRIPLLTICGLHFKLKILIKISLF